MKPAIRKIIFWAFLATFFISAPLVVLYTAGYRWNFSRFSLVKTGLLSITTFPKNATIFLDGKPQKTTPAILENIMPGLHKVRLLKDGYLSWEKTLEIKEQETTFAPKVVLFSDQSTEIKEDINFSTAVFDATGYRLGYVLGEQGWWEIWVKDLSNDEKKLLLRLPQKEIQPLEITWSANGKNLFVKETTNEITQWQIVGADGSKRFVVEDILKINGWKALDKIIAITPDPFDDNIIYAQTEETVWLINLNENRAKKLFDQNLVVWQRGELLLFLQPTESGVELTRQEKDTTQQVVAKIPVGNYRFLPAPPTLVLLQDVERHKIILVDDRGIDKPIYLEAAAFAAYWNPDNQKQLLYVSDFELHIYDADRQSDELLTRISSPITGVAWHPSGADILFSDNQNLSAIELDKRGAGRNVFPLAGLETIGSFTITNDSKKLFLCGEKNAVRGVFEKNLGW
ncbi:MAG: PEGA domain-containing protein [Candidatus Uhrbacteria bacterium]